MSTKISKQRAYEASRNMSDSIIEPKKKELNLKLEALLEPFILVKIPKEIIDLHAIYPNYFDKTSTFRPVLNGNGEFGVSMSKKYPSTGGYGVQIEVNKEVYSKMLNVYRKIEDLSSKRRELQRNIEATLLQLSTFKKINENFAEAMEFIPQEWMSDTITSVAIPISNLRDELAKYKVN